MSDIVIRVEDVSKQYRLGKIGTGTFSHDLNRWWHTVRGKEDPYLKIGDINDRSRKGDSEYVWALKDISFDVKQGEVLGIIGRNGAGKSTLLKILSRTTLPTKGELKIKGRIASLLEVGTGFHPELTGRENIFLNGAILGMTKAEIKSKFDEIVDFSGVEKYIDTPVKRYSSGMYVRLAFAVAAFLEPEILIVDEVLAVGDVEFQKKCIGRMKEVSVNDGRTVLFVSHNIQAIASMCDTILLLERGQRLFNGGVGAGIEYYLNSSENVFNSIQQRSFTLSDDEVFELFDFKLYQESVTGNDFYSDKEIIISFEYKIKKEVVGLRIGFDLLDRNSGLIIFRAFHDDSSSSSLRLSAGVYNTKMIIKNNFLKENSYQLNLSIGIHNVRWITHEEVKFYFNISNIYGINKLYADNRPGIIMPQIESKTYVV